MTDFSTFKAGYVAIIGKPNAGKSTLMNSLLELKLSIVTSKAQTTRKKVTGILSNDTSQIIFIDTPGLIEPKYEMQKKMMDYLRNALIDANVIVYLLDIKDDRPAFSKIQDELRRLQKPVILALNKIDGVDKKTVLPLIEKYQAMFNFQSLIPISALKTDGLDQLLDEIRKYLPFSPPYYPLDYVTDQQERFFVAEIIREKIFELYAKEIPYSVHVDIEAFKERKGRKDLIQAVIYVERRSQKGIMIGKGGAALKKVGALARRDIEVFLERPVFLELYVRVMDDWRNKDKKLRELGY